MNSCGMVSEITNDFTFLTLSPTLTSKAADRLLVRGVKGLLAR